MKQISKQKDLHFGIKVSPEKIKEYEAYVNSPEAKLEKFLDKLEDERRAIEAKSSKNFARKNFRWLARRAMNG